MASSFEFYDLGVVNDPVRALSHVETLKKRVDGRSFDSSFGGAGLFYRTPKSVILARNQSFEDLNLNYVSAKSYQLAKRATGGGAVLSSEKGNLLSSLFLRQSIKVDYLESLANSLGVNLSASHDFFENEEGGRYAGHAQRYMKNGFVQLDGIYNLVDDFSADIVDIIKNRFLFKDAIFDERGSLIWEKGNGSELTSKDLKEYVFDSNAKRTDLILEPHKRGFAVTDKQVVDKLAFFDALNLDGQKVKDAALQSLASYHSVSTLNDVYFYPDASVSKVEGGNLRGKGFCFAYPPSLDLKAYFK